MKSVFGLYPLSDFAIEKGISSHSVSQVGKAGQNPGGLSPEGSAWCCCDCPETKRCGWAPRPPSESTCVLALQSVQCVVQAPTGVRSKGSERCCPRRWPWVSASTRAFMLPLPQSWLTLGFLFQNQLLQPPRAPGVGAPAGCLAELARINSFLKSDPFFFFDSMKSTKCHKIDTLNSENA